jgi:hypothetical protein
MKALAYIAAAALFIAALGTGIFGLLYILGAFSPEGSTSWLGTGIILVIIAFLCVAGGIALIYFTRRSEKKAAAASQNVVLNVDLPGNVSMDTLKCQSCGGALTPDDIKMVAGAPVVTCPYCHTTYQLTEEPKW